MAGISIDHVKDDVLFNTFVKSIEDRLVEEAIKAIRPRVKEEVKDLIKTLEGNLQRHYNIEKDRLVFLLRINGVPQDENG